MKKEENVLYLEIALDEMQRLFSAQMASFDTIKTNVRAVLSSASLIVSLVSALQLLTVKVADAYVGLYRLGIGVVAILYVALMVMCVAALLPVRVVNPLLAEWDTLTTAYKGLSKKDALLARLSSVLNAIEKNTPEVERFRKMQIGALALLPLLVITLLLLTLLPKA